MWGKIKIGKTKIGKTKIGKIKVKNQDSYQSRDLAGETGKIISTLRKLKINAICS
jgi:hypothetical protein